MGSACGGPHRVAGLRALWLSFLASIDVIVSCFGVARERVIIWLAASVTHGRNYRGCAARAQRPRRPSETMAFDPNTTSGCGNPVLPRAHAAPLASR